MIFEENSLYMKKSDWMEMYEHAVEGDHDFLFINYQKPKRLRAMKNFDQVLFVEIEKKGSNIDDSRERKLALLREMEKRLNK